MNKIKLKDIQIMWETNRWDGLLSGICKYNNQVYYFDCIDWNDYPREYELYYLDNNEILYFEERHNMFRKYVGTHCDYMNNKRISDGKSNQNRDENKLFYDKYKNDDKINLKDREVIGTFKYKIK